MSPIWTQPVPSLNLKHPLQSEERRRLIVGLGTGILLTGAGFPAQASGKPAESFVLPRLVSPSDPLGLASLKGKWVYLDFWASWCTPCKVSFPWMQQMHLRYQSKGLEIVAICLDRDAEKGRQFLAKETAGFHVLWDSQAETAKRYGVVAMPSSYLIDPKGMLMSSHAGFTPAVARRIEAEFSKLIG